MSRRGHRVLVVLAVLAVLPLLWLAEPFIMSDTASVCAFRNVFGQPCPLCGMTRALVSASHGHWELASGFNRFWWVAALLIFGIGAVALWDLVRVRNDLARLRKRMAPLGSYPVLALILVLLMVF